MKVPLILWDQIETASDDGITSDESQNIRTMSADAINALPVQDVDDIVSYQCGTVTRNGDLHIRGGRTGEVGYIVDGVDTKDPRGGISASCNNNPGTPAPVSQGQWLPDGGNTPPQWRTVLWNIFQTLWSESLCRYRG